MPTIPNSIQSIIEIAIHCRSLALPAQGVAQAAGPLASGVLYDWSGNYTLSLHAFAVLSALSILSALAAKEPARG